MFEIPDDDGFWDDFTLQDDNNVAENKTTNNQGGPASFLSGIKPSTPAENNNISSRPGTRSSCAEVASTSDVLDLPGRRKSERKFPGPAGLLPAMPSNGSLNSPGIEVVGTTPDPLSKNTSSEEAFNLPTSQAQIDDVGSLLHWQRMVEDLGPNAQTFLSKFSIKSLLLRACRKMLNKGKAPLVFGVLETLDMQGPNASFVIRDETGKMKGSLHKNLVQDPKTALHAGCALILRQVSVISPSARTHYLNVTPGNVVFIYSSNQGVPVKKRSWPSSPMSFSNSESSLKDCIGSPSLQKIIQESERELSLSLKNFHNMRSNQMCLKLSGDLSLPQATSRPDHNVSSPPFFNSNILHNSGSLQGLQTKLLRPVGNTGALGGVSLPLGYKPAPRFPRACLSESPLPSGHSPVQLFRQQVPCSLPTKHLQHGLAESGAYMISGEVAVRRNSKLPLGHSGKPLNNGLKVIHQTCDKSNSSKPDSFNFDFPEDNEDGELLQLCDETLMDNEIGKPNNETSRQNLSSVLRVTSNVISEAFRDCLHENSDSNLNSCDNQGLKREAQGCQLKSAAGRTFTFKRNSSSLAGLNSSSSSLKRICVIDQTPISLEQEANLDRRLSVLSENQNTPASVIGNAGVAKRTASGGRDSRIQLGQKIGPVAVSVSHVTDHALESWDDDLTEDLLLSQLSEEF